MSKDPLKVQVGYWTPEFHLSYTSDTLNGECLDTTVDLLIHKEVTGRVDPNQSITLCTIAGNTIKEFDNEFKALINKYKI